MNKLPEEYHFFTARAERIAAIIEELEALSVPASVLEPIRLAQRKVQDHAGSFIPPVAAKLGAI
jgi:hypothetical protein